MSNSNGNATDARPAGILRDQIAGLDPTVIDFLREVLAERHHQDAKWGRVAHTPEKWLAIHAKWQGKFANAVLVGETTGMRRRLVQLGALALAQVEIGQALPPADPALDLEDWVTDLPDDWESPEVLRCADAIMGEESTAL